MEERTVSEAAGLLLLRIFIILFEPSSTVSHLSFVMHMEIDGTKHMKP